MNEPEATMYSSILGENLHFFGDEWHHSDGEVVNFADEVDVLEELCDAGLGYTIITELMV